ncbi:uncharacterized protein AMSG_00276 [Thecamonas trahens ATCC 50062]|uniref:Uncharacterized protein n=1 Tax=Thecamonas trahens ATCC 50062 TaxID=461836 RepID=A0A0L0D1N2_THETB|nr:hypothetical protein AMSG_00276 [Thecamonas trahens ATCC 50062]KNC46157.1 hypothetical protein AMSG_00276 [Thecamonas trahens ATCC 50062]|eukprot:XP_013763133.1 hypothetical protein AMSG_00276 [Thecamonas trahens ATCC 50062]
MDSLESHSATCVPQRRRGSRKSSMSSRPRATSSGGERSGSESRSESEAAADGDGAIESSSDGCCGDAADWRATVSEATVAEVDDAALALVEALVSAVSEWATDGAVAPDPVLEALEAFAAALPAASAAQAAAHPLVCIVSLLTDALATCAGKRASNAAYLAQGIVDLCALSVQALRAAVLRQSAELTARQEKLMETLAEFVPLVPSVTYAEVSRALDDDPEYLQATFAALLVTSPATLVSAEDEAEPSPVPLPELAASLSLDEASSDSEEPCDGSSDKALSVESAAEAGDELDAASLSAESRGEESLSESGGDKPNAPSLSAESSDEKSLSERSDGATAPAVVVAAPTTTVGSGGDAAVLLPALHDSDDEFFSCATVAPGVGGYLASAPDGGFGMAVVATRAPSLEWELDAFDAAPTPTPDHP